MDMYDCEKTPTLVADGLEQEEILDVALGEFAAMYKTSDRDFYIAGLKSWWSPAKLSVPEGEKITSMFTGQKFTGVVTDANNMYAIRYSWNSKEVEEVKDHGIWKVSPTIFLEQHIEKVGGGHFNHYAILS
jgi:hypothetical protein